MLSNINLLIEFELEELWENDIDTKSLNPNLEPLTIIANIIRREDKDDIDIYIDIIVNSDIINISNLNNIKIIFFRHQHILRNLIIIIIFIK